MWHGRKKKSRKGTVSEFFYFLKNSSKHVVTLTSFKANLYVQHISAQQGALKIITLGLRGTKNFLVLYQMNVSSLGVFFDPS